MSNLPATPRATINTNLQRLTGANALSQLGDGVYQFTLPLIAVSLTRDPQLVAGLNLMLSLPWLLFSLWAGRLVDRSDRRALMVAVNGMRALLLGLLTLALITDHSSIWLLGLLYVVALLLGIGETLVDTALTSIVPALSSSAELSRANARIEAGINLFNQFLAPPLAGLLSSLSFGFSSAVSALLYTFSGATLTTLRGQFKASLPEQPSARVRFAFWMEFTVGLRFLWKQPLLRDLTVFTAAMNLCWALWSAMLVLYVVQPGPAGLNNIQYSLLLTAMAVGGVLGAMVCIPLERLLGRRTLLALDLIGTVVLVGTPALTTNPWLLGVSLFIGGLGSSLWRIIVATLRQSLVPDTLLGQVYASSRWITWGISPVGAVLAGFIAVRFGVQSVFVVGGILAMVLLVLFSWRFWKVTFSL